VSNLLLNTIKIKGWRNYAGENLNFGPGINLLLGNNGQGKTNLLEAIYFLSGGQSPRTNKLEELIKFDENYFYIRGEVAVGQELKVLEMGGARDGRRMHKIQGVAVHRLSDFSDYFCAVFFLPEDLNLVKSGPAIRRRFLDQELSKINNKYRNSIEKYKKFLQQRNALLKSNIEDKILMQVLTNKIAELAGPISKLREDYIEKLSLLARLRHRKISGGREELSLAYKHSVPPGAAVEDILAMFDDAKEAERKYRTTIIGPHRDDFAFIVNGMELRTFGSQGQQRTAVLSLKLAELELIKAETGEYPLLLLDDVFSELDEQRREMLLHYLSGRIQTFISSSEPVDAGNEVRTFWIEAGTIKERV